MNKDFKKMNIIKEYRKQIILTSTIIIMFAIILIYFNLKNNVSISYDIDKDGVVGKHDVEKVVQKFGQPCEGCPEDINKDNKVDSEDYRLIIGNYGLTKKEK